MLNYFLKPFAVARWVRWILLIDQLSSVRQSSTHLFHRKSLMQYSTSQQMQSALATSCWLELLDVWSVWLLQTVSGISLSFCPCKTNQA